MLRHVIAFGLILVVAGCGRVAESRFNPFNWFSPGEEVVAELAPDDPLLIDPRPLVADVTDLTVERTPGGAIIRASGVPPVQGWYDGELVPITEDIVPVDGVLTFTFRARPPEDTTRVSTAASREIVVGTYLSDAELQNVRRIEVIGQSNSRVARR